MLISAKGIYFTKKNKHILDNVSLDIVRGDLVTIIGPNGAGKSTLLKCLMGVERLSSGVITRAKDLRISYVPQTFTVPRSLPLRVMDFLLLNKKTNTHNIITLSEQTNTKHLLEKQLFDLSGGEVQKILLLRSLLSKPDILFLDEAAQGLDISGQLEFYKLIEEIWQTHKITVVLVSHDLHMVMAKSKKVLCLFHHICCSGQPGQVIQDPVFAELFGKSMQDILAVYNHHHDHSHKGIENVG